MTLAIGTHHSCIDFGTDRAWEAEERNLLVTIINGVSLSTRKDSVRWLVSGKEFTVHHAVMELSSSSGKVSWNIIWKLKVPQKIKYFLWKMHLNILPTRDFLVWRGIKVSGSNTCTSCGISEETIQHLFYDCRVARNLWQLACSWWNFEDDFLEGINSCNLWDSAKLIRFKKAKFAWQVVISATLWVIWLSRNDAIVNNVPVSVRHNLTILKSLAREWCLAENLITVSSTSWWDHNPMGSITKSEADQMKALCQVNWDLIAFLDGSWKIKQGNNQAGVGGYIQQKNGNAIFSFSGPSSACSAFQAEWNALSFLLTNFARSRWSDHSLLIYSDCNTLICKFLELFSADVEEEYLYLARLIKPMKVYIKLISRDLNCRADLLAKQGAQNFQMARFWAHN